MLARRRAQIVGLGLIGGSLGMALRERGWTVTGRDSDPSRSARAVELGAVDGVGTDTRADVTFVATPVKAVAEEVRRALASSKGLVTDVGSVKWAVVDAVGEEARFVGGHPMAGSEREGVEGSDANLFRGAVWVLTPTERTDGPAFAQIRAIVSSLGAEAVSMPPEAHDRMVAVVSHVPHLTAATLMNLADERATDHRALLRLAAGGFRDMTRIASGHPAIWPDICEENREAIVEALDSLLAHLADVRAVVAGGEREQLTKMLEEAREARLSLPVRAPRPTQLVELRIPVPDRPGAIAEVAITASELLVNIYDLEIAHNAEGATGVMHVLVEAARADALRRALDERGFVSSMRKLV
ncbi:MAG: prephenate dehydrogenase/arogenate dehydrogenase family protein [Acidimicrobiia bacterium]|nr:prephenate dehydrogenase/arogenate dehydrogenase family protein [Acidimicrobiia bacterium]